eukprot:scaffold46432_cov87-Cyclotella_meneghiniana.AAC.3
MAEELSGMDFMSWAAGGLDTMDGTGFLTPLLIQESGSTSNDISVQEAGSVSIDWYAAVTSAMSQTSFISLINCSSNPLYFAVSWCWDMPLCLDQMNLFKLMLCTGFSFESLASAPKLQRFGASDIYSNDCCSVVSSEMAYPLVLTRRKQRVLMHVD